jgi:hypothetical protein
VRFEVLTAARIKMAVFWVVAPCSLVEVYRRFRGFTIQKTAIFKIYNVYVKHVSIGYGVLWCTIGLLNEKEGKII